jgi:hypothetical protein
MNKEKKCFDDMATQLATNEPRGKKRDLKVEHMNLKPLTDVIAESKKLGLKTVDAKKRLEQADVS